MTDDDLDVRRLAEQGDQPLPLFPLGAGSPRDALLTSLGPNVVQQVFCANTLYGCVARCGCGWKAVHDTETAARTSGSRHVSAAHGVVLPASPDSEDGAA
jgi:hypothetical protein